MSRTETASQAHGSFTIPSLDGIRSLAFGLVFMAHAGLSKYVPAQFGVTAFFFLSGYLITTLLRREHSRYGRISLRNFYVRRAFRILPPAYLILVAATVTSWFGLNSRGSVQGAISVLLHYTNYHLIFFPEYPMTSGTGPYWSLAVEEHFYLIFPWIFMAIHALTRSRGRRTLILVALCVLGPGVRALMLGIGEDPYHAIATATHTRYDSILFGCILALWENPVLDESRFSDRCWRWLLLPMGVAALLMTFLIRDEFFRHTVRYTVQGVALIPLFVCAIRYPEWWPFRMLNSRPLMRVGILSYSLYLSHTWLLAVSETLFPTLGIAGKALAAAASYGVASGMHRYIERPFARMRRRWLT